MVTCIKELVLMSETLNTIKYNIELYYGDFVFLIFAVIAFVYLAVTCKELRGKFLFPIGLVIFCVVNPILYKFVFSEIIYWRMFWMIPDAVVIAIAAVYVIKNIKDKFKVFFIVIIPACVMFFGTNVYKNQEYKKTENYYKVPNDVIELCDIMLAIDDTPKCVMPVEFYLDARQYNGNIELLYGRNVMDKYIVKSCVAAKKIYQELNSETPDYDYILAMSNAQACDFLVLEGVIDESICLKYGYIRINTYKQYHIYYNQALKDGGEGWVMTMKATSTADSWNKNFITIEDGKDGLIIIDGGNSYNSATVRDIIKSYYNHVEAWIITNPHILYSQALQDILENHKDIQIDNIYTIAENEYDYQGVGANVSYVDVGDTFDIADLTFTVEYKGVDKDKYAMMCLDMVSSEGSFKLYTSLSETERSKVEEMGIKIPDYNSKVDRYVIK